MQHFLKSPLQQVTINNTTVKEFRTVNQVGRNGISFVLKNNYYFTLQVLEKDIVKISTGELQSVNDNSFIVVDSSGDVPITGRPQEDLSRFSLPEFQVSVASHTDKFITYDVSVVESHVSVSIQVPVVVEDDSGAGEELRIVEWRVQNRAVLQDAYLNAYVFGKDKIRHSLNRNSGEFYYGVGESSGLIYKNNRRIRIDAKDAMGYDAELSDPLYKHYPYCLTLDQHNLAYGLLYDTQRRALFDFGQEISAFRGSYRYFEMETTNLANRLNYYVLLGPTPEAVSRQLILLTGSPQIPPPGALGYIGSSMSLTEKPNGEEELLSFLERLRVHDILDDCTCYQLSSGYTTDSNGNRCVFTWNRQKFPSPLPHVFDQYNKNQVPIVANVKPWLLRVHPHYEQTQTSACFVQSEGKPHVDYFWSAGSGAFAEGSYLDFTSAQTQAWWKKQATDNLLRFGCQGLWNDNNEYEIELGDAVYSIGGSVTRFGRALQTMLMARASRDALVEFYGNQQDVLVISRSGGIGCHRYACQTWSGDNSTSFKSLRFNIAQVLSLGLCGWVSSGPDVGGFAGEKPSPELFLRWVQVGVFLPRFCIHSSCWKDENASSNEPWMYPDHFQEIKTAIKLRSGLLTQLYSLHVEAFLFGTPVIRPLFYHYPSDPMAKVESFQFLLGRDLLVAPILYEEAACVQPFARSTYFPAGDNWFDLCTKRFHAGNTVESVLIGERKGCQYTQIPCFVREGGGLVLKSAGSGVVSARKVILVTRNVKEMTFSWFENKSHKVSVRYSSLGTAQHGQIGVLVNDGARSTSPVKEAAVKLVVVNENDQVLFSGEF